ncbi:alpha/beta-hydrolase [Amylostereum chailletii]|nr:alpha/beta-hydrolase [Amylostereum chailletii]
MTARSLFWIALATTSILLSVAHTTPPELEADSVTHQSNFAHEPGSTTSTPVSPKIIDLGYATYQSDLAYDNGVTSFLGIRFASPPTGDLRWKAPRAPAFVSGIQNATSQPPQCPQPPSLIGSPGTKISNPFQLVRERPLRATAHVSDEDCLFLNIHTPSNFDINTRLPVVLWIHGGGYDSGNDSSYPVQDFVQESDYGVVAVHAQYRLGVLGFLPGKAVRAGGDLNVGLLDQQFALQWIQKHIASFGGDPGQVTIWGQSAGAGSVLQHLVAHGGRTDPPLFRAAMMESPFLPFQYHYDEPIPESLFSQVVGMVGCANATDSLDCLRSADVDALLNADITIGASSFMWTYTFVPVVDDTFILERPIETFTSGKVNGEILYVNTNSHEGTFFVNGDMLTEANFTLDDYVAELFPRLGPEDIERTVDIYTNIGLPTVTDQAAAVIGDNIFVCPAYYALEAFGVRGYKASFAIPPGTHAQDLSYVFTNFAVPATFNNTDFQRAYAQAFLSTAMFLDPNVHFDPTNIAPYWPEWAQNHTEMLFNKTDADAPAVQTFATDEGLLKRCGWWRSIGAVTAQ